MHSDTVVPCCTCINLNKGTVEQQAMKRDSIYNMTSYMLENEHALVDVVRGVIVVLCPEGLGSGNPAKNILPCIFAHVAHHKKKNASCSTCQPVGLYQTLSNCARPLFLLWFMVFESELSNFRQNVVP